MKSRFFVLLALVAAGACDRATAPPKPSAIRVVAGDAQKGTAGSPLATTPTFLVVDERGGVLTGVGVIVTVAAGGGTLTAAPTQTTVGATSVGTWTLGQKAGVNQLTVQVNGLPSLTITATGAAGAPAKIAASSSLTISGRVGEPVLPAPSVVVSDAFDNPVGSTGVTVVIAGGGAAPPSLITDANGRADVGTWTLGTVSGQQTLTLTAGVATTTFVAAAAPGDPTQLLKLSGDDQSSLAGAVLPEPIMLRLVDRYNNGIGGRDATLAVTAGGGSTAAPGVVSAEDGSIAISSWTLGRSVAPQALRATVGSFSVDLTARIRTDYNIEVRFYGPPMTDAQRALFTNAAARLSAIITGDLPDAFVPNVRLSDFCGIDGLPILSGTVDDVVIYASVREIDGPRGILAQAGPCLFRPPSVGFLSVAGVMEFDAADIALMSQQGTLQDVITHEMLHVLGVGTLWSVNSLLRAAGTPSVGYYGVEGTKGCLGAGGSTICATNVPVENSGGPGTADAHWRETTFGRELMTGFVNTGGMPLSRMTVGSLGDIGYLVNPFAADPFTIPSAGASPVLVPDAGVWERPLPGAAVLDGQGGARLLKRP